MQATGSLPSPKARPSSRTFVASCWRRVLLTRTQFTAKNAPPMASTTKKRTMPRTTFSQGGMPLLCRLFARRANLHPPVPHPDVEAARRIGGRAAHDFAVLQGQLGAVPRAADRVAHQRPLGERPAEVRAGLGNGEDPLAAPDQEDGDAARHRAGRLVLREIRQ